LPGCWAAQSIDGTFARQAYPLRGFRRAASGKEPWAREGNVRGRSTGYPTKKLSLAEPGWAHSHHWLVGFGISTSAASTAEHKFLPFQSGVRARHGLSRKGTRTVRIAACRRIGAASPLNCSRLSRRPPRLCGVALAARVLLLLSQRANVYHAVPRLCVPSNWSTDQVGDSPHGRCGRNTIVVTLCSAWRPWNDSKPVIDMGREGRAAD